MIVLSMTCANVEKMLRALKSAELSIKLYASNCKLSRYPDMCIFPVIQQVWFFSLSLSMITCCPSLNWLLKNWKRLHIAYGFLNSIVTVNNATDKSQPSKKVHVFASIWHPIQALSSTQLFSTAKSCRILHFPLLLLSVNPE